MPKLERDHAFDWIIVGGGIAGIAVSEILTRNGYSVALLEKNTKLASETSGLFHEWLHFGSLYTLIPNKRTLRYVLGGIDDLLEFYNEFQGMNLHPSADGMRIEEGSWFTNNRIIFRFKLKRRRLVIPWIVGIARSSILIDRISSHDWLRRRAGEIKISFKDYLTNIPKKVLEILFTRGEFFEIETPDILMNSRSIINDLVTSSINSGLTIFCNHEVKNISRGKDFYEIETDGKNELLRSENVALANGKNIRDFLKINTYDTFAPIVIAENIESEKRSFTNLDYFPRNCINQLYKGQGVSMLGGISFKSKERCPPYIDYIIKEHKKLNPKLKTLDSYIGVKTEFLFKNQDRNYIFNIFKDLDSGIWTLVPGKFSLAFSMATEFFRQISSSNSTKRLNIEKSQKTSSADASLNEFISEHIWQKIKGENNGPN